MNNRQITGVAYIAQIGGGISNSEYQRIVGTSERTALRDLDDLVSKQILEKRGDKKMTRYYLLG